MKTLRFCVLIATFGALLPLAGGTEQAKPHLTTLWTFTNAASGLDAPMGVVPGRNGKLYGPAVSGGYGVGGVFELIPPTVATGFWTANYIYSFSKRNGDGANAWSLTVGQDGVLYGTTQYGGTGPCQIPGHSGCGTVFSLTPPSTEGGQWTEQILHSFGSTSMDGTAPLQLTVGNGGALYGTTQTGGVSDGGTVFRLSPPTAGGDWTESIIYRFTGESGDGSNPSGGVVMVKGALYGVTMFGGANGYGTAFGLTPPASPSDQWVETILFSFPGGVDTVNSPINGVIPGPGGVFYGTTALNSAGGAIAAIYQLTPPPSAGGAWTMLTLYEFPTEIPPTPPLLSDLALGPNGALFGTTVQRGAYGGGEVYSLVPPAGPSAAWTYKVLYNFPFGAAGSNPSCATLVGWCGAGLIVGGSALYGTTSGLDSLEAGTVFRLVP
jgi:uncharacterized repeat protein (TIGR03803 family)